MATTGSAIPMQRAEELLRQMTGHREVALGTDT
jgi:hypothetical protein